MKKVKTQKGAASPKRKIRPYAERDTSLLNNLKKARRCPDCGAKVLLWPCLACNPNVGCY